MDELCQELQQSPLTLAKAEFQDFDLNDIAKKESLTIYYNDGKLRRSKRYGPEIFVCLRNGMLIGHHNPGLLAKLPTGVGKIKGCKFKLSEILGCKCKDDCNLKTNWAKIERKIGKGINIWRKISTGLNKNTIKNLRRSNLKPAIHLHCDKTFNKIFLVTCPNLYFRGNKKCLN